MTIRKIPKNPAAYRKQGIMKLLFIHQNFPGQYLHLAHFLSEQGGHDIYGMGEAKNIRNRGTLPGITTIGYPTPQGPGDRTHHYLKSTEAAVRRGQTVARSLLRLKGRGFVPDVIAVHPGWGEALFIRDVYPDTPMLQYCEYYVRSGQADRDFDPEYPHTADRAFGVRIRNAAQLLSLAEADACVSPTAWQASRYPPAIRDHIRVIHDGLDTDFMRPDPEARVHVQSLALSRKDKIITYAARSLEPYRGFHVFMRSLPDIQKLHPDARVLIAGDEGNSYSDKLPEGQSYKKACLQEVGDRLDLSRVHFLGNVPYPALRALFRISSAHVYLTYPFVLSWSALEAMACESLVIASATEPVQEVITGGENGLLVDFFDQKALAARVDAALREPERFAALRQKARQTIVKGFSLPVCLPRQAALLEELARK